ncbi:hypothetical protein [Pannonibacter tanglangensis]|uniref:FkbM family methyltransferase n=1 Tax=Pannonibacter tanglangensis TaxID=2750084 RepID=A0ABW9ZI88_9HYPH|nr:hypothetical protein [Pannonibacter sp. XCT-34]NBN64413.1 hypothetical protein [Pannonibacter sp. XCT-34]
MGLFRTLANKALQPFNYMLVKAGDQDRIASGTGYKYATRLNARLLPQLGYTVRRGAFAGARILNPRAAGPSPEHACKVLGQYELELHPALLAGLARRPGAFINVGMADGYYIACLKHLAPALPAIGYEINPASTALAEVTLEGIAGVEMRGGVTAESLTADLARHPDALLLVDIEGYERVLLDIPAGEMARASLVIELHDDLEPNITDRLTRHLAATHEVTILRQQGRDPFALEELDALPSYEKFLLLCEFRGPVQTWLQAVPKS